jgi:hypothetical protein
MAARNYTGMIWRAEKVAEARAFHDRLAKWRNDLRPMSPEYDETTRLMEALDRFGEKIGGEALSQPAPRHTAGGGR